MLASEFLTLVFGGQQNGYVCLAAKRNEFVWHRWFKVGDFAKADAWVADNQNADLYYCPNIFTTIKRQKAHAAEFQPCSYEDLDDCHPDKLLVKPSILIESSPNRWQALWLYETPVPTEQVEQINYNIAYNHASAGADKSGWDITQLLRLPGTPNHKYPSKPTVRLHYADNRRNTPAEFSCYPAQVKPVRANSADFDVDGIEPEEIPDEPGPARNALDDILLEKPEHKQRSKRTWWFFCRMAEKGLRPAQIVWAAKQYQPAIDKDAENPGWLKGDLQRFFVKKYDEIAKRADEPSPATEATLVISGAEFLSMCDVETPPLWGLDDTNLWESGESLMVVGPPGVGKSTLAHLLVFARLGLLETVLGMPVADDGGRVLYLAMDRPKQIARAMKRLVTKDNIDVLTNRLVVKYGPFDDDILRTPKFAAELAAYHQATTIVVDSVKDVLLNPSDETSAGIYNRMRQTAIAQGIEWIELHHNRKSNGENKTTNLNDDVYGSRWLTAGAGSVIGLFGQPGDPIVKMSQLKSPAGEFRARDVIIDKNSGQISFFDNADELSILRLASEPLTINVIAAKLYNTEKPSKNDVENLRNKLNREVGKGTVVREQPTGSRSALYRIAG